MDAFWVLWNWWGNCSLIQSIAGAKESTLAACRGKKKISSSKAAWRHARDTSVLSCRFCNCVRKGRIGQNGDAESHVLVSECRMLYGISALVSCKPSLSSPVILHFMSLQLLAPITSSTWVSLHAASHQLRFPGMLATICKRQIRASKKQCMH